MTTETNEMDNKYAGHGVGVAGLTLGIIGTSLAALAGGRGVLGNLLGNGGPTPNGGQDYITKEEFELNNKIMEKDGEIALLKSDKYTDAKILETYTVLADKIENLRNKVDCNRNTQDQVNYQQGIWNATSTATVACIQNQVSQLMGMTRLSIPNSSICPGWGAVTITPSTLSA